MSGRIVAVRLWLVRVLLALVRWISPDIPMPDEQVLFSARLVVASLEGERHTGSYKRVQALKRLTALYPRVSRRRLALALELAVQERAA